MEQQRNWIQNLWRNLLYMYCISDLSGLHQGDRLKTAVHLFYTAFIVNNSILGVIPSVILNLDNLEFKHLSCIISEHIA